MAEAVLDASAVLALINGEPGADLVAQLLPSSMVSSVNLSEVVAKLADFGMPQRAIRDTLDSLRLDVVPFDAEQAYEAGLLRLATRGAGLSLGDRACLALAGRLELPALTTDASWTGLRTEARVRVIR